MENTTMFGGSLWIWVIFIGFTVISWLISHQLKSRFQKYSKIPTANGMTGRDVVEKMLRDNGVTGVKIGSVEGMLTDHYNPVNKTINLSRDVYYGNSIAAAAVAAHETGHALHAVSARTTEADGCQKNRLFFIYFFPLDESYIRSGAENPSRSMQVSSTSRTRSSSAR